MTGRSVQAIRDLARVHGVQLTYTSNDGSRVRASTDALVATLVALGVPADGSGKHGQMTADALDARRSRGIEPVVVLARDGGLSSPVTLPAGRDPSRSELTLRDEDGDVRRIALDDVVVGSGEARRDDRWREYALDLQALQLPPGYYDIELDDTEALLIAPPRPRPTSARGFGVFQPVYGLRGGNDWGVGTFSDLAALADDVAGQGGEYVGTLPMFPMFFGDPVDPSPYLPVSRLFVNELFLDVEALPEYRASRSAQDFATSAEARAERERLSGRQRVDYAGVMALKRRVLEECAAELLAGGGARRDAFEQFRSRRGDLASYAAFRAAAERDGSNWRTWATAPGAAPEGDENSRRFHEYVQFAADAQLADAATRRAALYLDLPVGVHPDGFDVWSWPDLFAPATVGAPPDQLAPKGQAWGFPPLHPERIRHARYDYFIRCLRQMLAFSGAIRVDHVLGLHRMFWIPEGMTASEGTYVRYRSKELLGIITLEASRANAVVVGEDLGTVSPEIRHAMDREGMLHSFVWQFQTTPAKPFPQPRTPSMASFGTHDVPKFAAFWRGRDIDDSVARGVTTEPDAEKERAGRRRLVAAVSGSPVSEKSLDDAAVAQAFARCIESLAAGPAEHVLVDLGDIEGAEEPDNRPGTGPEADNWTLRLSRPLAAITSDPYVRDLLSKVASLRRTAESRGVNE